VTGREEGDVMEPRERRPPDDEEARELDERAPDLFPEDEDFDPEDDDDLGRPAQLQL
jgi:hypothetical protein